MARKHRLFRKFGLYHILQRGNNKSFIFNDPLDKSSFFEILTSVQEKFPFNLIYFVIMDNHYHLLIEMLDDDISVIMRCINLSYSRYYNSKYGRIGTIFGGRYKSIEVSNERYFTQLIGYFAHNPVRAKIVKTPSEYQWCTHYDIVRNQSSVAHIGRLFELIDDSQKRAKEIYAEIINEGIIPPSEHLPLDEIVPGEVLVRGETIEDAIMRCLEGDPLAYRLLNSKGRSPERSELRRNCANYAYALGFTTDDISSFFGITSRAVRYLITEQGP